MAVTFGTPVVNNLANRTSFTLAMSGVTSGQPILVFDYEWIVVGASGISDDFATPYTWTRVQREAVAADAKAVEVWIGTGGAGTSGTITVTRAVTATWGGIGVACVGASTAAGLDAVDSHNVSYSNSSATVSPYSLTPSASGQGALYCYGGTFYNPTTVPASPWVNTPLKSGTTSTAAIATYASPASGTPLSTSWVRAAAAAYNSVSVIVKSASSPRSQAVVIA